MALETLHIAQHQAADLLGISMSELEHLQEKEVHELGDIILEGKRYPAFRAYTGPEGKIGKGGIRFAEYPDVATGLQIVQELSGEMYAKLGLRNHLEFRGAKGLVMINAWKLTAAQKQAVSRQFEVLMEKAGLAGHDKDVPAGDIGTNGLPDFYAAAYAENHPTDPYRHAVITGKSAKAGGLGARAGATGLGALAAQLAVMEAYGQRHVDVSIQGFGNAGAWYAYYASNDVNKRITIKAISEREGMLWTDDPAGLPITREMVERIGDNMHWVDHKLEGLAEMIRVERPAIKLTITPDPMAIFTFGVDYFVPAAMGDIITEKIVPTLGARLGINEIANGPTTAGAHRLLVESGKIVIPDFLANSGGVDTSITEWQANIDLADGRITHLPSDEDVEAAQRHSTHDLTMAVLEMADELGTYDLRVAAAALSITRLREGQSATTSKIHHASKNKTRK